MSDTATKPLINSEGRLSESYCVQVGLDSGATGKITGDAEQDGCVMVQVVGEQKSYPVHQGDIRTPR